MPKTHQLAAGVQLSRAGDRCVLFNSNSGKAIVLNPSGSLLAEQLQQPQNEDQLAVHLTSHFAGLNNELALRDALAFLEHLAQHQMLKSSA